MRVYLLEVVFFKYFLAKPAQHNTFTNISDWPGAWCPVKKYLLLSQKCLQWADRAPSRLSSSFCWQAARHEYPQYGWSVPHEHTWNAVCPWNPCLTSNYMRWKRNRLIVIIRGNPHRFLKGKITHMDVPAQLTSFSVHPDVCCSE